MPTKKPVKEAPKKSRLVILIDTVRTQNTHKLNAHKIRIAGDATPTVFKNAVFSAYNDSSAAGGANIIYLAEITPKNKKPKLIARLYQAKRNTIAPKRYKMFATFHHPDGERLRKAAKLKKTWFEKSEKVYPSRPPVPVMNTLLTKLVRF